MSAFYAGLLMISAQPQPDPAGAQPAANPAPASAAASSTVKPNSDDEVVCKRESRELEFGSHMRAKKKCMTRAQWAFVEAQTREQLQRMQDHNLDPGGKGQR